MEDFEKMRRAIMQKITCLTVAILFFVNDICFGLGTMPASVQTAKRNEILDYARGKFWAAKEGRWALQDAFKKLESQKKFTGEQFLTDSASGQDILKTNGYDIEFVPADYSNPPAGWENNHILQQTDLIKALEMIRDRAGISKDRLEIKEGWFFVDNEKGELPIDRIEAMPGGKYVMIVHTDYAQKWKYIREHDIWFRANIKPGERRTVSVANSLLYRPAYHAMTVLSTKDKSVFKSHGHFMPDVGKPHLSEDIANMIGGNYALPNDAAWMWYLGSFEFADTTRYNNGTFLERMKWFFESKYAKQEGLAGEFMNLFNNPEKLTLAMAIAYAINYNFFNRPGIEVPITPIINLKSYEEALGRDKKREDARIAEWPIYATGKEPTPVKPPLTMAPAATEISTTDIIALFTKMASKDGRYYVKTVDRVIAAIALLDSGIINPEYIDFLKSVADNVDCEPKERVMASAALLRHGVKEAEYRQYLTLVANNNLSDKNFIARIIANGALLASDISVTETRDFLNLVAGNLNRKWLERIMACAELYARGIELGKYDSPLRLVVNGSFADYDTKLFAHIALLNVGVEIQESLAYLQRIAENQNQDSELRYTAYAVLLGYYTKLARAEEPISPDMAKEKRDQSIKALVETTDVSLVKIISEYIVRIGSDKGPGAEKLSFSDPESIYKTVGLLENSQIEIFIPQHLRLTEDMQKAIKEIGKREGKTPVSCRQYSDLQGLAKMLESPSNAKRIVLTNVTDKKSQDDMVYFVRAYPEFFRYTRLLNIATPTNYQNMDNLEKTVYQAKIITITVLARLFERDKTPMVESLLRGMVKGCLDVDDRGMDAFMSELGRSEDGAGLKRQELVDRILFLLGKTIKVAERIGQEIQLMKNFWIAA